MLSNIKKWDISITADIKISPRNCFFRGIINPNEDAIVESQRKTQIIFTKQRHCKINVDIDLN